MAKAQIYKGSTSNILELFLMSPASTLGSGVVGQTFHPGSGGPTCRYKRNVGQSSGIPVDLTGIPVIGTYTANGFGEVPNMHGIYEFHPPDAAFATGSATSVVFNFYNGSGMAPTNLEVELIAYDNQTAVYHADIQYDKDGSTNEYTVTWFRNGVRIQSGITSPTINVYKRTDGTNLIPGTGMTEIGSTHSFKYDESTNVQTAGETYLVVCSGTIDGAGRGYSWLLGRDS